MSTDKLFAGEPQILGGLSNERELAELCPDEFKNGNAWSSYAMTLFYRGGNIGNWKWKSDDKEICSHQIGCFKGLLGTFDLRHEDREAVAGWMLSEMLTEVPEHVPAKESEDS